MSEHLWNGGDYNEAKQVANKLAAYVKPAFDQMPMMIDYFFPNDYFLLLRFHRWDEVLKIPKPAVKIFMTTALWHYARTLALVAKEHREEAMAEQTAFTEAQNRIPTNWMWMFNTPEKILNLAMTIVKACLATDEQTAIEHWKKAIVEQDNLNYDEPPGLVLPGTGVVGRSIVTSRSSNRSRSCLS